MGLYIAKAVVSALVIVAVSEIAKRSTFLAAALASLPLISILAFVWLYVETRDVQRVASLSLGICWLIPPSLIFFLLFPLLLRGGWSFWSSIGASCAAMAAAYGGTALLLSRFGIRL